MVCFCIFGIFLHILHIYVCFAYVAYYILFCIFHIYSMYLHMLHIFLAVPVPPPGAAAPRHVPDMRTVMQRTGGPNHEDMLRELDDHMGQGNSGFPSERCGGGARRLLLKRNASQMSRSLSETFAYLTSKTASTQEAADVLQTFANVGLVFCSCS